MAITEVRPRGKSGLIRAASALRWREYSGLLTWYRLSLGLILALAAFLNTYRLVQIGYANTYYAAAVLSIAYVVYGRFLSRFLDLDDRRPGAARQSLRHRSRGSRSPGHRDRQTPGIGGQRIRRALRCKAWA